MRKDTGVAGCRISVHIINGKTAVRGDGRKGPSKAPIVHPSTGHKGNVQVYRALPRAGVRQQAREGRGQPAKDIVH